MKDTMTRFLGAITEGRWREALRTILNALVQRYSSQAITSAGLVIKTGGSALAKTGSADWYGVADGVTVSISAGTDMPALTGIDITAAYFNVVCFFVDKAGTVTAVAGTEGATLADVAWPQFPDGQALVGALIITYASAFTGGTTPLDTATTVYLSPTGAFDPTVRA